MIDAVFISDLHLSPADKDIEKRFDIFLEWAKKNTRHLYILGDFFHVWAGDDLKTNWSQSIAKKLAKTVMCGVSVYLMRGNRDFLLGDKFARQSLVTMLADPYIIDLGDTTVLLTHGDQFCSKDKAHQRFRLLTRNWLFRWIFLSLPGALRQKLVTKVRNRSLNKKLNAKQMDVVDTDVIKTMRTYQIRTLIHGHTHKPGLTHHENNAGEISRYVLSDWDDCPTFLCYSKSKGIFYNHLNG